MTGQLGESTLGQDNMHEINMRLNSVAKCHNLKTYQACGCTEITTVSLQDSVIHKEMKSFVLKFHR